MQSYPEIGNELASLASLQQLFFLILEIDDAVHRKSATATEALRLHHDYLEYFSMLQSQLAKAQPRLQLSVILGGYATAKTVGIRDGLDGQTMGTIRKVHATALRHSMQHNLVCIVPTMVSHMGQHLVVPVVEVATQTSKAVQSGKLIYCVTKVDLSTLPKTLTLSQLQDLVDRFDSESKEHRVLNNAVAMSQSGVDRLHIVGAEPGNLLTEVYTQTGSGILITHDNIERFRPASVTDIPELLAIMQPLEEKGYLVPRDRNRLEAELCYFTVLESDGQLVGAVGVLPTSEDHRKEIAAVAIHPAWRKQGHGKKLMQRAESIAKQQSAQSVFVLTVNAIEWFIENGYTEQNISYLPENRSSLYNYSRNARVLMKELEYQDAR